MACPGMLTGDGAMGGEVNTRTSHPQYATGRPCIRTWSCAPASYVIKGQVRGFILLSVILAPQFVWTSRFEDETRLGIDLCESIIWRLPSAVISQNRDKVIWAHYTCIFIAQLRPEMFWLFLFACPVCKRLQLTWCVRAPIVLSSPVGHWLEAPTVRFLQLWSRRCCLECTSLRFHCGGKTAYYRHPSVSFSALKTGKYQCPSGVVSERQDAIWTI